MRCGQGREQEGRGDCYPFPVKGRSANLLSRIEAFFSLRICSSSTAVLLKDNLPAPLLQDDRDDELRFLSHGLRSFNDVEINEDDPVGTSDGESTVGLDDAEGAEGINSEGVDDSAADVVHVVGR